MLARSLVTAAVLNAVGLWGVLLAARLHWVFDVLTSFAAYSALFGVVGVVGSLLATRRAARWLGVVACLLAVVPTLQVFAWRNVGEGEPLLKLVCFNVWTRSRDAETVERFLKSEDPDVFVLLEADDFWVASAGELSGRWPHSIEFPRDDNFGIVVRSKYPLLNVEKLYLDDAGIPTVSVRMAIDDVTKVQLLATHPLPPKGNRNWRLRNQHLDGLASLCRDLDQPLVLLGDLNVTPWSPFYEDLVVDGQLIDARRAAFGLATTWNARSSLLNIPIDHAFVRDLDVLEFSVGEKAGSDHLPIVLTVGAGDE